MTSWFEILTVAFVFQLAVLPGEKVQFIIAALSTRYRPLVVVGAAGLAFAGWTAVEIALGELINRLLSPLLLDSFTAVMFVVFGVMLLRSMPDPETDTGTETAARTDGGYALSEDHGDMEVLGYQVPRRVATFVSIFAMMAAGEFGDKTQVITITLASRYGASPAIWAGEMLAIIPVSLANAYFFNRFSHRFDPRKAHLFGAGLFFFFGLDTLLAVTTRVLPWTEQFSVWETVVSTVSSVVLALV